MSPEETYREILGLVEVNDWGIFPQLAHAHPEHFPPEHMDAYREIGDTLTRVIQSYEYTKSPAFLRQIEDRSEEYAATKIRFEEAPVKREKHRQRFVEALVTFPASKEAFELLDKEQHESLHRIASALEALARGV